MFKIKRETNLEDLKKFLEENLTDLNQPDENGNTLLHQAVEVGKDDLVNFLCEQKGIIINPKNKSNFTPYALAAYNANLKIFEFLKNRGGSFCETQQSIWGLATKVFKDDLKEELAIFDIFCLAASEGKIEVLDFFLKNVNKELLKKVEKIYKFPWKKSAYTEAMRANKEEAFIFLVAAKNNILEYQAIYLVFAIKNENLKLVRFILKEDIAVEVFDGMVSQLLAILSGQELNEERKKYFLSVLICVLANANSNDLIYGGRVSFSVEIKENVIAYIKEKINESTMDMEGLKDIIIFFTKFSKFSLFEDLYYLKESEDCVIKFMNCISGCENYNELNLLMSKEVFSMIYNKKEFERFLLEFSARIADDKRKSFLNIFRELLKSWRSICERSEQFKSYKGKKYFIHLTFEILISSRDHEGLANYIEEMQNHTSKDVTSVVKWEMADLIMNGRIPYESPTPLYEDISIDDDYSKAESKEKKVKILVKRAVYAFEYIRPLLKSLEIDFANENEMVKRNDSEFKEKIKELVSKLEILSQLKELKNEDLTKILTEFRSLLPKMSNAQDMQEDKSSSYSVLMRINRIISAYMTGKEYQLGTDLNPNVGELIRWVNDAIIYFRVQYLEQHCDISYVRELIAQVNLVVNENEQLKKERKELTEGLTQKESRLEAAQAEIMKLQRELAELKAFKSENVDTHSEPLRAGFYSPLKSRLSTVTEELTQLPQPKPT